LITADCGLLVTLEDEMSCQWYLIYRYRWMGTVMVREPNPIDGVYASHADAAVQVAATRNDYRTDERLNAVFCSTAPQRVLASELDGRHTCDWWSRTDFIDWMCQPAYEGNYPNQKEHK
jgi:hypothetical protein